LALAGRAAVDERSGPALVPVLILKDATRIDRASGVVGSLRIPPGDGTSSSMTPDSILNHSRSGTMGSRHARMDALAEGDCWVRRRHRPRSGRAVFSVRCGP